MEVTRESTARRFRVAFALPLCGRVGHFVHIFALQLRLVVLLLAVGAVYDQQQITCIAVDLQQVQQDTLVAESSVNGWIG